jgi:PIN domain nuclease of toxin-antitoxin system
MNGCLIDTNIALLATIQPDALTPSVRSAIEAGPVFLSTISFWEVVLKSMKRNLDVGDPRNWWKTALEDLAATPMLLAPDHIAEICNLPPLHADPFDRALIAQATVAELSLATTDTQIVRYSCDRLRIVS